MPDFSTQNPTNLEAIEEFNYPQPAVIERVLSDLFSNWQKDKSPSVSERSQMLQQIAVELRRSAPTLGLQMTLEMGKPIKESLIEIEKSAVTFDYFADELEKLRAVQTVAAQYSKSQIVKDSWGPLLAVMPWNFPLWQITRLAAPAVGIGNPILLKHSEISAGTARVIQEIFDRVRPGLLIQLPLSHEQAAKVIEDRRIRGVSLTGSARAGKQIGQLAAKNLKKTVMELGGSDAYLVLQDANPECAGQVCARGRLTNNGQSCVSAKRFIVDQKIKAAFLDSFMAEIQKAQRGDPQKLETQLGPLAHKKFQTQLLAQCAQLEKEGAKKLLDLSSAQSEYGLETGAYFPARVYEVSAESSQMKTDEFFGPVALVIESRGEEEAIKIANSSVFGLGGAIFSSDLKRAEKLAHQLECGFVAINEQVKSDARLPFGGVKDSGYGRELSSFGFDEFCNIKSVGTASASGKVSAVGKTSG